MSSLYIVCISNVSSVKTQYSQICTQYNIWTDLPYDAGPKVSAIFALSISTCSKQVLNHFLDLLLPGCGESSKALSCSSTDS